MHGGISYDILHNHWWPRGTGVQCEICVQCASAHDICKGLEGLGDLSPGQTSRLGASYDHVRARVSGVQHTFCSQEC